MKNNYKFAIIRNSVSLRKALYEEMAAAQICGVMERKDMQGKKFVIILTAVLALCPLLSGCGGEAEKVTVTSLRIGKDGSVTSDIVEDFGKENYTVEGLEAMIREEAERYNTGSSPNAVILSSIATSETEEGKVLVTMQYASSADYMEFNGVELFYGTPAEAEAAGFKLNVELIGASDAGSRIGREEMLDMKTAHILIVRQSAQVSQVVLPEKILYISEGTLLAGNKTATLPGPDEDDDITWTGELTYILTK